LYSLAYDLLPDEALRKEIRGAVARIMDHILTNRYELVDVTGKPTKWGRWSPEYFATPEGRPDAPLNAVELLSFLCVSHHVTGDEAYLREYRKLTGELHYPEIAARYSELREELNYSDEELAMLSFYPLLRYETDRPLLTRYRAALDQWWANMSREENPLWTFIYLACNPGAAVDTAAALGTLRRIPLDLVSWTVSNSHRRDIRWEPSLDRFGKRQAQILLPADERPVMKWNGNPFVVDGGDGGRSEDDGTFFLLPYWMGRHLKFVPGY